MSGVDSSGLILEAIDKQLFSKRPAALTREPAAADSASPVPPWWTGIIANLRKVCSSIMIDLVEVC